MARPDPQKFKRNLTPTNLVWKAYVDLQLGTGQVARQPLLDQHVVIGRSPNLQLPLDHDTVSRRHAELYCDPFGRWWIRDLGSTNGTLVNGEVVGEKVLQPGDRIGIGDYNLFFHVVSPNDSRPRADTQEPAIVDSDESPDSPTASSSPSWVRSLRDLDPPKIAATHLSTLMSFSRRLMAIEAPDERLTALCNLCIGSEFHGMLAMILRARTDNAGPVQILSGPHRPPAEQLYASEAPYLSSRLLRSVVESGEPALASNLPRDGASLELTLSAEVIPLSTVACPLGRHDGTMDLLYVTLPPQFGSPEWLALLSLAAEAHQQSETAWAARHHEQAHMAIERELETARNIQHALVPHDFAGSGLDIAIGFEPCKWVGGDYVDVVRRSDGRLLLAVADVCGKGLQAALVTFSVHTMLHATADDNLPLPTVMRRLNEHLCRYLPQDSFVTMACVVLDPQSGQLECVNAGHLPPFVVSESGEVRHLQAAENPMIGVAPAELYSQHGRLAPGEMLALYTDGLTELRGPGGHMLGETRLSAGLGNIYRASVAQPMTSVADELAGFLSDFSGNQVPEDDRAFLLARLGP